MRIAILSDIHGNLPALEAVLADITGRGVDAIVNLGDSLSGPLMPLETAQFLMNQDWPQLAGNHERQILELHTGSGASDRFARERLGARELAWLASLPPTLQFASDVFLCHGSPGSDMIGLLETVDHPATPVEIELRLGTIDAALVACGHTHVPRCVRSARGQWLVNPGSVGLPAYAASHPYPHVVATGSPDARYAIVTRRANGWQSELLTVPYDHRAMAALARANGRAEWEQALLTGYISMPD